MSKFLVLFAALCSSACFVWAQNPGSAQRITLDEELAPFYHGVASGDPLPDAVIIWTRVTTDQPGDVAVEWKVATDTNLTQVVKSGQATAKAAADHTVKVDVTGLSANTWYYYGFETGGKKSLVGRTKTAPTAGVSQLRFAVASCADYQAGFYNAYERIVNRNDIDAVLFLGDYIYEYAASSSIGRLHEPATEILSLSDYRQRHSQYHLDPELRLCHQQYPWIVTWDDHETANNSYKDGAENHTPATEGDWETRKNAGKQAYFEWLPIRLPDPNDTKIYREITYGNLADIFVLDTRLEGRDKQNGTNNTDTNRTILGKDQLNWLLNKLKTSTAQWKVVAQQVMFGPLEAFGLAFNEDQWDGYKAERRKIIQFIKDNNINNVVILTGDIHTAWGNDIYLNKGDYTASTGAGSFAVEFVATSITSDNSPIPVSASIIKGQNPHIKYVDLTSHGYCILDLQADKTQCDWYNVETVSERKFTDLIGESLYTENNGNHLVEAPAPTVLVGEKQPFAPFFHSTGTSVADKNNLVVFNSFPNPFEDQFAVQYYLYQPTEVKFRVVDLAGKVLLSETVKHKTAGLFNLNIGLAGSPAGHYYLIMEKQGQSLIKKVVKTN